MHLDRLLLTEINDISAESAEQDQTARMCSLILLYTLRKINPRSRTAGQGLQHSSVQECLLQHFSGVNMIFFGALESLRQLWFAPADN